MTQEQKTQFENLKANHSDCVLIFQCGDFYEAYEDDAEAVSRVLGATLTESHKDEEWSPKQAGFPHHALDQYLPRLIRAGLRIGICDQLININH